MGVNIDSKNCSIDMGYFGFARLRNDVAKLTNNEIFEHFDYIMENYSTMKDKDFDEWDRKLDEIIERSPKYAEVINSFLAQADCEGSMTKENCQALYKIIKNYDNNRIYGYAGCKNPAKFRDFKELIKDGAENDGIIWS